MTNKRIAILQSNYIPWKGYFDIINSVDEFILYDEMQYTKNDWRNRNRIKTANGVIWLTIPVETKGRLSSDKKISEVKITDKNWNKKHWKSLQLAYSKAPFFKDYKDIFEELYLTCEEEYLSKINLKFILKINEILGITTKISYDIDYGLIEGKTERLVDLCQKANATEYLSGPSAKNYIEEDLFNKKGIKLLWKDYSNYEEYPQLYPPFEHNVSILDLIFNTGKDAIKYIRNKNE